MSVVNKMLNDLENRSVSENGHSANYKAPEKSRKHLFIYRVQTNFALTAVSVWLYLSVEKSSIVPVSNIENPRLTGGAVTQLPHAETESLDVKKKISIEATLPKQDAPSDLIEKESPAHSNVVRSMPLKEEPKVKTDSANDVKLAIVPSGGKRQSNYQTLVADALASNNAAKAKLVLSQWIGAEPMLVDTRKKLAALYFGDGQYSQAEQLLIQTQMLFPSNISVRLMQARLYSQLNKHEQAWHVLNADSLDLDFLHYRASLARRLNKNEKASQDYGAIVTQSPNDIRAWLGLGIVSESLEDTRLATKSYQRVVALVTDESDVKTYATQRLESLSQGAKQ